VAPTLSVVLCPALIVRDVGWDVIVGGVQPPFTVTVAVAVLAVPHELRTRTQYVVVVVGETVSDDDVAPLIGMEFGFSVAGPVNH
jgi:hypothetical protein